MTTTTLNQLIKLEHMLLDNSVRTSKQKLDELLHDDLIEIGQSGIYYTKNDVLDLLPNLPNLIFKAKNFKYIELNNDKYLLVYLLETSQKGSSEKILHIDLRFGLKIITNGKCYFIKQPQQKKKYN